MGGGGGASAPPPPRALPLCQNLLLKDVAFPFRIAMHFSIFALKTQVLEKAFKLWDGQLYLTLVYIVFRIENAKKTILIISDHDHN